MCSGQYKHLKFVLKYSSQFDFSNSIQIFVSHSMLFVLFLHNPIKVCVKSIPVIFILFSINQYIPNEFT